MRSFVTATMIADRLCSPRRDAQGLLPQLVAKLIKNSIAENAIRRFRFPDEDQIYLHGPDGILVVDENVQHPEIPDGISLWEIKTSADPRSDANEDFSKAEEKLTNAFTDFTTPITPDQATFVFVTSKPWEAGTWIREKRKNSNWKSIRVLDAVALKQWIEKCPQVMLWFAEQCGLPAEGLYDAEQYLHKIGVGFGVSSLSPELVLAGRDEAVQTLKKQVIESNANLTIRGESPEEAAVFLAAASLKDTKNYAKASSLVFADSRANLNLLATASTSLILVPLNMDTLKRAKTIPEWKPRFIVPDSDALEASNNEGEYEYVTLGRCKRVTLERHLIEEMNRSEHEARLLARDTKGSLVALLWSIGSGPTGVPRWASRKDATTHASLILAGSWLGDNDDDTRIIERLARKDYRDIETLLQSAELPEGPWIHRGTEWRCVSRDYVWRQLIGRVTETMLKDFQEIAYEVLGESNPALELPRSEQSMAGVLGKKRKYSRSLRAGLVDSLARLAIFMSDGQSWADRILRHLLDPNSPEGLTRWLSLADVYSELAEASPNVFLDCLEERVQLAEAGQFFQNEDSPYDIFAPTSAHVHLLWALERLAWQIEYLPRVLSMLAKLAEIEPTAKTGNNPQDSIIKILLPWSPQHNDTMRNAARILKGLYAVSPTVTWNVGLALLPSSHGVQSPSPTPLYREYHGERHVTLEEYWEFSRSLVEMMILWADLDANRWASLIEQYPDIWRGCPELGQSIPDALALIDMGEIPDADKAIVCTALQKIIFYHRRYPDSDWAMPDSVLSVLEEQRERFLPSDAVLRYSQLFSWNPDPYDAPMQEYQDGWDEWIQDKRIEAIKEVYDQGELEDVRRLAEMVEVPGMVGSALARIGLSEIGEIKLLRSGLATPPRNGARDRFTQTVQAYVCSKFQSEGDKWLEKVLASQDIEWTENVRANLTLALPASPSLWERVQHWGVDRLYWSNVDFRGNLPEHWAYVLPKWQSVGRYSSSLELLAWVIDERHDQGEIPKPPPDVVMDVLGRVLQTDENVEPLRSHGNMLSYYIEHLFLFLDSQNAELQRVAELEWRWLHILRRTKRGTKALHTQITSSPKLFVDLLQTVFRGEGEPQSTETSEEQSQLAEHGYHLLKGIHTVPGYRRIDDQAETVDQQALLQWVEEARALSQSARRLTVCDSQIGEILSYAPNSPDGSWPCVEVRNVIEHIQSNKLDQGLHIGKQNQRGVVCRGPGGSQERELAAKYHELAEKVKAEWPRTAGILEGLARSYEGEAQWWDEQEKRDEYE